MKRREAREQAFQILFEQAVSGEKIETILESAAEARDFVPNSFAQSLVVGTENNSEKIDAMISENIRGWNFSRLSKVTLAILRLSTYEIIFDDSIPVNVSINEAVELAKIYGGKDEPPYINGVLSSIAKKVQGE